ncbi:heterokaryon incompatibility protein-domain-containing protein, partial [Trametes gibbosa]
LPPRPHNLCQVCWEGPFAAQLGLFEKALDLEELLKGPYLSDGGYSYSISQASLNFGAATGCVWCKLILPTHNRLPNTQSSDDESPTSEENLEVRVTVGRSISDSAALAMGSNSYQELLVIVNSFPGFGATLYASADDPAAAYITGRPPLLDVGSTHTLSLAKTCLDECIHEHKHHDALLECPGSESLLPTRLIDCTDPERPRLASTAGQSGKYVALSYVWGQDQPHKTTTANIDAYKRGIDPSLLPQTIRDAIRVTHSLGLRMLWVDTLCIIQDSAQDKLNELGHMHHIYRNAYLAIIAANAHNVSEGFLQQRTAPEVQPTLPFVCTTTSSSPSDVNGTETASQVGQIYMTDPHYFDKTVGFWGDADRDPIKARAWCLQEYMMSPRMLVFASQTIQYRCSTTVRNVGRGRLSLRGPRLPGALLLPTTPAIEPLSVEWSAIHDTWLWIVQDYSRRAITFPSDKLVACSAVAAEYHRVLRSDYLAGFWRASLLKDLLWHVPENARRPRPTTYRAPSWSWAAVDGGIMAASFLGEDDENVIAELVRCEITLKEAALLFGEVTSGTLVLRAPLI